MTMIYTIEWLAELFDRKGGITFVGGKTHLNPVINLASVDIDMLKTIRETLDIGNISYLDSCAIWKVTSAEDITRLTEVLLPYLKEKKELMEHLLEFVKSRAVKHRHGQVTLEEVNHVIFIGERRKEGKKGRPLSARSYLQLAYEIREELTGIKEVRDTLRIDELPWRGMDREDKRLEAIKHISDVIKCNHCGQTDIRAIQIDHIYGMKGIDRRWGINLTSMINEIVSTPQDEVRKKYQLLCANCNWIKEWPENKDTYQRKMRYKALVKLSGTPPRCSVCGYSDARALQVDHIHGGGMEELREITSMGVVFKILRMASPGEEYQVLCGSCNYIKEIERRIEKARMK